MQHKVCNACNSIHDIVVRSTRAVVRPSAKKKKKKWTETAISRGMHASLHAPDMRCTTEVPRTWPWIDLRTCTSTAARGLQRRRKEEKKRVAVDQNSTM